MNIQKIRISVPMQDGGFTFSTDALKAALENVNGVPIVKYIGNTEIPIGFVESAKVDESTNQINFSGEVWSAGISFIELAEEHRDGKRFKISSVNI